MTKEDLSKLVRECAVNWFAQRLARGYEAELLTSDFARFLHTLEAKLTNTPIERPAAFFVAGAIDSVVAQIQKALENHPSMQEEFRLPIQKLIDLEVMLADDAALVGDKTVLPPEMRNKG